MKNKKYLLFLFSVLTFAVLSFLTSSCADDPSSLGLKFIPPGETTGVRIFDSFVDTMAITSINKLKRTTTSSSNNLMVGSSATYSSKALLKFNSLSNAYDSGVVNSATITLKYNNYYYPPTHSDSLGQTGFDIYKVQQYLNYGTITLDSVSSSSFGTVSVGNYTGFLTADTQAVTISLNPQMVQDWLSYAVDTNRSTKNYGIVLSPNAGSNVIKAFYSGNTSTTVKPNLTIIVTKNNKTDTLNYNDVTTTSLVDGTPTQGADAFSMQGGIGYVQVMKFDMSHIPQHATINDARIFLTIDSSHSLFSTQTLFTVEAAFITDSANGIVTSGTIYESSGSGNQQVLRMMKYLQPCPFQMWLDGTANEGLILYTKNFNANLDLFSFFNINSTDPTKRPRVIIKYTPRVTP